MNYILDVFEVTKLIPKGRVTTYGTIASYLGLKRSARMVGWALNQAHNHSDIPAHRVVNKMGILTGKHHFENGKKMQELLESEGIKIINNQVVEFDKIFWDPLDEFALFHPK